MMIFYEGCLILNYFFIIVLVLSPLAFVVMILLKAVGSISIPYWACFLPLLIEFSLLLFVDCMPCWKAYDTPWFCGCLTWVLGLFPLLSFFILLYLRLDTGFIAPNEEFPLSRVLIPVFVMNGMCFLSALCSCIVYNFVDENASTSNKCTLPLIFLCIILPLIAFEMLFVAFIDSGQAASIAPDSYSLPPSSLLSNTTTRSPSSFSSSSSSWADFAKDLSWPEVFIPFFVLLAVITPVVCYCEASRPFFSFFRFLSTQVCSRIYRFSVSCDAYLTSWNFFKPWRRAGLRGQARLFKRPRFVGGAWRSESIIAPPHDYDDSHDNESFL